MTKRRSVMLAAVVTVVVAVGAAAALAGHDDDGFITAQPKMLTGVMPGVEITPLLTVGDELPGGYMFEAIPDGIALDPKGKDVDVWVNHETSKVPFPFSLTATVPGEQRERLRQRAAEPPRPRRQDGPGAERRVRDPEQRRLPALLLELPGHEGGGLRPGHPLRRARSRPTTSPARRTRGHPTGRRADGAEGGRPRRRARREGRARPPDLRHGPAQPRERGRAPRLQGERRALGRRHVHERTADERGRH